MEIPKHIEKSIRIAGRHAAIATKHSEEVRRWIESNYDGDASDYEDMLIDCIIYGNDRSEDLIEFLMELDDGGKGRKIRAKEQERFTHCYQLIYDHDSVGGLLHVLLDDYNVSDGTVNYCREIVESCDDDQYLPMIDTYKEALDLLDGLSQTDRFEMIVAAEVTFKSRRGRDK